MTIQIGVLADDLSGGMNIGVEFAQDGYLTQVIHHEQPEPACDVLIINTDTRNLSPKKAFAIVQNSARTLRTHSPKVFVKKIDSLMRGNIGQEIDAVIVESDFRCVLLTPAAPKLMRQVFNGYIHVDGKPLKANNTALDPLSMPAATHVGEILSGQTQHHIHHLDIGLIQQEEPVLSRFFAEHSDGLIITDCATQDDLNQVVAAAYRQGVRFFAGTYGMGEAVCHAIEFESTTQILVLVGSMSAVAQEQVKFLQSHTSVTLIQLDFDNVQDVREYFKVKGRSSGSNITILHISATPLLSDITQDESSHYIETTWQAILAPHLEQFDGFVATGGTTAQGLMTLLDCDGLRLESRELIAGVPFARIQGGQFDSCPFIIKPGSQGNLDSLYRLARAAMRGTK